MSPGFTSFTDRDSSPRCGRVARRRIGGNRARMARRFEQTGPAAKLLDADFRPLQIGQHGDFAAEFGGGLAHSAARARWSSGRRATCSGAPRRRLRRECFLSMPGASVAGPSVAMILVRRRESMEQKPESGRTLKLTHAQTGPFYWTRSTSGRDFPSPRLPARRRLSDSSPSAGGCPICRWWRGALPAPLQHNQFNFRLRPPPRGLILDRNGVEIASNRPDFRLLCARRGQGRAGHAGQARQADPDHARAGRRSWQRRSPTPRAPRRSPSPTTSAGTSSPASTCARPNCPA